MSTPIRVKRSSDPGKIPTLDQLQLGELAVNVYDGKLFLKQDQGTVGVGTRIVEISAGTYVGKTIFVTANGNDSNSGLNDKDSKATIKAAAAIALPGDTIKVFPGVYLEDNPIILAKSVAIEGSELRNCIISPKNLDRDLFHVNNGTHITDVSFISSGEMENDSAIITFEPLNGVSPDRFFDAARMIRMNLDFIANETVGYVTSTDYDPLIEIPNSFNFAEEIKKVYKSIIFDITRGGNSKTIETALSLYNNNLIVGIKTALMDSLDYSFILSQCCVNNVGVTGHTGNSYQNEFYQVKDLSIQSDLSTNSNEDFGSCANVISAIYSCVGIADSIIESGPSVLGSAPGKITTTYPGNLGIGHTTIIGVTTASYDNKIGRLSITAPGSSFKPGDVIEIRDLIFDYTIGGNTFTQKIPFHKYGNQYYVERVREDNSFDLNVGISTIPMSYISGGFIVNRFIDVENANYNNMTGDLTITSPGCYVKVNDFVRIRNLEFTSLGNGVIIPNDEIGQDFKVIEVSSFGNTFKVNIGISSDTFTYTGGGLVHPPYSRGVGPITQGPYIRNCTNFVAKSIGMKVDGFDAEPGDEDDIGVTGSMSVDSYTQYNQAGIGVSITNGSYAQLVSIFTICNDIAHYTSGGGQCDITNSNCSFGNKGLVAIGVGNENSKSIYRMTGVVVQEVEDGTNEIIISGIGNYRPYTGQVCYFGKLYKFIDTISVVDGGYGYTVPPRVTIDPPTGPRGVTAQATAVLDDFGRVSQINIVNSGTQYETVPNVTITPPSGPGIGASAVVTKIQPIYYKIDSATLPSAGISTISLLENLNNIVSVGTTVYFFRQSLQVSTTISLEYVGSGTNINLAKPALGGITVQENEVIYEDGGLVVYTSTDQSGNFRIGDGVVINQATGQIGGRDFTKSLFTTITPFVLALSD